MNSFWHGPPSPNATLQELREYIRPKTQRLMTTPPPVKKKETSHFQRRYGMDPRTFLLLAHDDPRWNDTAQEAFDLGLADQLEDGDLELLAEAYFNEAPDAIDQAMKAPKPDQKKQRALSEKRSREWWKSLKMPRATSAGASAKGSAISLRTGSSPAEDEEH